VNALGNLAHFLLLPGQHHDSVGAAPLLDGIQIGALIADKGFDTVASQIRRRDEKRADAR
jgi:hypothetical protein